jgi:anaphase-promoting complex subunit 2
MMWGDVDWSSSDWYELLEERSGKIDADSAETLNLLLFYHHGDIVQEKVKQLVTHGFYQYVDHEKGWPSSEWLLRGMRWESLYRDQCVAALQSIASTKIRELCYTDTFDEGVLDSLKEWEDEVFVPFIGQTFSYEHADILESIRHKLLEEFIVIRAEKIFEMITEFPDSLEALKELRDSITTCGNIGLVGRLVRCTLVRRLLHLGASTSQILDFYVSMIKALRVIDPSDALLNYVAVPVRKYLKERKDAIRCIISSLTDSKDSDLHSELKHGGSLAYGMDEDDEDFGPGENWQPRKRNKELADASISSSRGLDILATLVSIYGSTELFIVEYKSLLASRLVNNMKFTTDNEVTNLELLKIRYFYIIFYSCLCTSIRSH